MAKTAVRRRTTPPRKTTSVRDAYRAVNVECTEAVVKSLASNILLGMPVERACDLIGLKQSRYSDWMRWGEDYLEASDEEVTRMSKADQKRGELYGQLYMTTNNKSAAFLKRMVSDLQNDEESHVWKRALNILERRDPKNWARVHPRHVGIGGDLGDQFVPDESFL